MTEVKKNTSAPATSKQASSRQERAIHEYLESLLLEVPDEQDAPVVKTESVKEVEILPHEEPESTPPVVGMDQLVAEVVTETTVETVTEVKIEQQPEISPVEMPESSVPEWAQVKFQCLLFNVSGLNMAVPLVKLNSVIPWDKNISETPNQTDWYLGLVQHLQKQVKVIDTALLVMPENRRDKIDINSDERLGHILLVDDFQWGLACTSIGDVIWLEPNEVKWRKDKSSRAWLSGTSLEHLCAIMDTEVFAKMLTDTG